MVLALVALIFTVMGGIDVFKNINGSHADMKDMKMSDFREGDIIGGEIIETLGMAIEEEETTMLLGVIPTSSRQSAVYYLIPYYDKNDEFEKIIVYRTGNKQQIKDLDTLYYETGVWYEHYYDADADLYKPDTTILVESAEVLKMSSEERRYLENYMREYASYSTSTPTEAAEYYDFLMSITVPYVVKYTVNSLTIFLIGVGALVIFVVIIVIMLVLRKGRKASASDSGYIPAVGADLYGNSGMDSFPGPAANPMSSNASAGDISKIPAPANNPFATKTAADDISNIPAPANNPFATKTAADDISNIPAPANNPFATKKPTETAAPAPADNPFAEKAASGDENGVFAAFANANMPAPTPESEPTMDSLFLEPVSAPAETPAPAEAPAPAMDAIDLGLAEVEAPKPAEEPAPEMTAAETPAPEISAESLGLSENPAPTPASSLEDMFPQTTASDYVADNPFDDASDSTQKDESGSDFDSLLMD